MQKLRKDLRRGPVPFSMAGMFICHPHDHERIVYSVGLYLFVSFSQDDVEDARQFFGIAQLVGVVVDAVHFLKAANLHEHGNLTAVLSRVLVIEPKIF